MAPRPFTHVDMPDWRGLRDQRNDREKKAGQDVMGYPVAPFLANFTAEEIRAARAMSALHGYEWDCVGTDPRVTGRRFLDRAKIALAAARDATDQQSARPAGTPCQNTPCKYPNCDCVQTPSTEK